MGDNLKIGAFYWVIPVPEYLDGEPWEEDLQPARYAGDGKWNYLNIEGESSWPVRYVGDEINPPNMNRGRPQAPPPPPVKPIA